MNSSGNNITVSSANCQGLQKDVMYLCISKKQMVVFLFARHSLGGKRSYQVKEIFGHECFISGMQTNSRGG